MVFLATKGKSIQEVYAATGRRKNAIARVRLKPGRGNVVINSRAMADYCQRKMLELKIMEPFNLTNTTGRFDVEANCCGGGLAGQSEAVRHGISRALLEYDPEMRSSLKKAGLLTRDPRVKERKKYGRKRARRGFQWTKR
jgi:small subunit ribosomal protein S9